MSIDYRTIKNDGFSEIIEKKSRFLGEAVRADTLSDAEDYIAKVRKKHYDARHHCFAYVVGEPGTPDEIIRSSDDGEPSGTAGKPMLEILNGLNLHRSLIVVTRYFGGTLLGTGGLVRAYSAAAKAAFEAADIVTIKQGISMRITCSYPAYGKFQYLFAKEGVTVTDTIFTDGVTLLVTVPAGSEDRMAKLVAETTDGQGICGIAGAVTYEEASPLS